MPVNEWSAIKAEDLYHQLERTCANDVSTESKQIAVPLTDAVVANTLKVQKHQDKSKKPCFKNWCLLKNWLSLLSRSKC